MKQSRERNSKGATANKTRISAQRRTRLFISHSHDDTNLADAWRELINAVTEGAIDVWYSNDKRVSGGVAYGEEWRKAITDTIRECKSVVVLITPGSSERAWLIWESGFAQGMGKVVIPVLYYVSKDHLHSVFQTRQAVDGTNPAQVSRLCEELVHKYHVNWNPAHNTTASWEDPIRAYMSSVQAAREHAFDRWLFNHQFHNRELSEDLRGYWFAKWTEVLPDSGETVFELDEVFVWTTDERIRMVGMSQKLGLEVLSEQTRDIAKHYPMEGVVSMRGCIAMSYWSAGRIPICGTVLLEPRGATGELFEGFWQGYTSKTVTGQPKLSHGRVILARSAAVRDAQS